MKKTFLYALAIAGTLTATAQSARNTQSTADGCNRSTPGWGSSLGRVSFKSTKTWKIGKQEWSDVVITTNCQKETYSGGSPGSFSADCRKNEGDGGSLFSWCAVVRSQKQLCTRGWVMPTLDDFIVLQETLEDIHKQTNSKKNPSPVKKYMYFGPAFEGFCTNASGELISQGSYAQYWSQSEFGPNHGYHLSFNISDDLFPKGNSNKAFGFTVRCVKTHRKAFPLETPVMVNLPRD